jgi:hypothetical protein
VVGGRLREAAVGLAKLRLDGFASIDAAFDIATLTTHPLRFVGSRLVLNIEPSVKGRGAVDEETLLQVELADEHGRPFPGFAFTDSDNLQQGGLRVSAAWKGNPDVGSIAGKAAKIRFRYKNAKLYSFKFE